MSLNPNDSPASDSAARQGENTGQRATVLISIEDPRVYLATERTLLAWVRTGVALIGLGFLIAKFGLFLRELALLRRTNLPGRAAVLDPVPSPEPSLLPDSSMLPDWIGGSIVVLGALLTLLAGFDHMRMLRQLSVDRFIGHKRRYLSGAVAILVGVTGLLLAAYLMLL